MRRRLIATASLAALAAALAFPAAGQVKLTFASDAGVMYQVLRSANLMDWSPLATVTGSAAQTEYTDTAVPPDSGRIFYRIKRQ